MLEKIVEKEDALKALIQLGSRAGRQAVDHFKEKARENLLLLLSGEWVSRALYVVKKLEIIDCRSGSLTLRSICLCQLHGCFDASNHWWQREVVGFILSVA